MLENRNLVTGFFRTSGDAQRIVSTYGSIGGGIDGAAVDTGPDFEDADLSNTQTMNYGTDGTASDTASVTNVFGDEGETGVGATAIDCESDQLHQGTYNDTSGYLSAAGGATLANRATTASGDHTYNLLTGPGGTATTATISGTLVITYIPPTKAAFNYASVGVDFDSSLIHAHMSGNDLVVTYTNDGSFITNVLNDFGTDGGTENVEFSGTVTGEAISYRFVLATGVADPNDPDGIPSHGSDSSRLFFQFNENL